MMMVLVACADCDYKRRTREAWSPQAIAFHRRTFSDGTHRVRAWPDDPGARPLTAWEYDIGDAFLAGCVAGAAHAFDQHKQTTAPNTGDDT